eukprot:665525-Lingulodinium_polyedra.AAC.1
MCPLHVALAPRLFGPGPGGHALAQSPPINALPAAAQLAAYYSCPSPTTCCCLGPCIEGHRG